MNSVATAMALEADSFDPEFVLALGDNFYSGVGACGWVGGGSRGVRCACYKHGVIDDSFDPAFCVGGRR